MEKDQRKKMQPVDCTNDYQMVLAGLRPPIVKKEITERDHFSVVKEAKKIQQTEREYCGISQTA